MKPPKQFGDVQLSGTMRIEESEFYSARLTNSSAGRVDRHWEKIISGRVDIMDQVTECRHKRKATGHRIAAVQFAQRDWVNLISVGIHNYSVYCILTTCYVSSPLYSLCTCVCCQVTIMHDDGESNKPNRNTLRPLLAYFTINNLSILRTISSPICPPLRLSATTTNIS